jgi:hypothetical protein
MAAAALIVKQHDHEALNWNYESDRHYLPAVKTPRIEFTKLEVTAARKREVTYPPPF